jgi:hypothetical protein
MRHKNRLFLNKDEGLAAVEWFVEAEDFSMLYVSANFTISDCSRKAVLEFDIYGEDGSLEERVEKVDRIIQQLESFKNALISEYAAAKDNVAQKKKKKKKSS